jgi:hypothetical protein
MVRDVTNWYLSMKECSGVAWPGLLKAGNVTNMVSEPSKASEEWHVPTGVRPGMLPIGIRASIFNTESDWAEKVELKKNVTENYFKVAKFQL